MILIYKNAKRNIIVLTNLKAIITLAVSDEEIQSTISLFDIDTFQIITFVTLQEMISQIIISNFINEMYIMAE